MEKMRRLETTSASEAKPLWEDRVWLESWQDTAKLIDSAEQVSRERQITDDDPLSIAREVAAGRRGAYRALLDDARTGLFEMLVERGHVSVTESAWDEERGGFCSGSIGLRDVSLNGLANPQLNNVEYQRRAVELNMELALERLYMERRQELSDKAVVWISPYPHDMPDDIAASFGYKPDTKRYMLRWIEIKPDGSRITKQLFMRNSNPSRLSASLRRLGLDWGLEDDLTPTGILAAPFIVDKNNYASITAVARVIDDGEAFLGGPPRPGLTYDNLELASTVNEAMLKQNITKFSSVLVEIAERQLEGELSFAAGRKLYIKEALAIVDDIASIHPELAREAIGDKAADLYLKSIAARMAGDEHLAQAYAARARAESDDIYACGMVLKRPSLEGLDTLLKLECNEFKLGEKVVCPACHRQQSVVSSNLAGKRLYCAFSDCKLARRAKRRPRAVLP